MRKGDIKKQGILDVAQRLFYQKGFEQTSVQDILSVLRCSKGSFYHHFESKMAVLETLCIERAQKAFKGYESALTQNMNPLERLNLLLYYAMPLRASERQFMALLLPMAAVPEGLTLCIRYDDAITEAFTDALDAILSSGSREGIFFIPRQEGMAKMMLRLLGHFFREIASMVMASQSASQAMDMGQLIPLAELYRYTLQRLVEAPFGSVEIIKLSETTKLLESILVKMRLEP